MFKKQNKAKHAKMFARIWIFKLVWGQKKNNCCVALKWDFWKSWVSRSENYFFFVNNFFIKHPKGPNLGAYSIIVLKKHPIWAKLGVFPTLLFLFLFLNRVGRWGQHNIFFSWPDLRSNAFKFKFFWPFFFFFPPQVFQMMLNQGPMALACWSYQLW